MMPHQHVRTRTHAWVQVVRCPTCGDDHAPIAADAPCLGCMGVTVQSLRPTRRALTAAGVRARRAASLNHNGAPA